MVYVPLNAGIWSKTTSLPGETVLVLPTCFPLSSITLSVTVPGLFASLVTVGESGKTLFTLFLGLLTLVFLERLSCKSEIRTEKIKSVILQVICVAALALVAELIRCDYGMQGILFIAVFYVCRNHRIYQVLLFLLAYMGATGNQPPLCTLLACLLILLYNGKRGKLKLKYFFYVFYPAHILVLYLIQIGLGKYLL